MQNCDTFCECVCACARAWVDVFGCKCKRSKASSSSQVRGDAPVQVLRVKKAGTERVPVSDTH